MGWISRLTAAAHNLMRKDRVESDLDAEVRSYAELLADEKAAAGVSEIEAEPARLLREE